MADNDRFDKPAALCGTTERDESTVPVRCEPPLSPRPFIRNLLVASALGLGCGCDSSLTPHGKRGQNDLIQWRLHESPPDWPRVCRCAPGGFLPAEYSQARSLALPKSAHPGLFGKFDDNASAKSCSTAASRWRTDSRLGPSARTVKTGCPA